MRSRLVIAWLDWALSALPVVVMAALAAWSYWLVRATPGVSEPASARVVSKLPDWTLAQFHVDSYDSSGRLTSRVEGARGWHHPSDDSMEVEDAQVWSQRDRDGQGRISLAQGRHLWVNGEQTQYRLSGDAQIQRLPARAGDPELSMQGQELFVDDALKQISSAQAVELKQGDRVLRGDRMFYDDNTAVLELKGKVSAWRPGASEATKP